MKKALIALLAIFIIIQFFRPERNLSDDNTYHLSKNHPVPERVNVLLEAACNDCHSNKTTYPWYSNIQPVAWWLDNHVNDGKWHLNFSAFTNRKLSYQNHKFEEIIEMVKEKEMPIPSYTWLGLHSNAKLSDEDRTVIADWAQAQMDTLKNTWPADSLIMKRR